jgi:hypothetical protein
MGIILYYSISQLNFKKHLEIIKKNQKNKEKKNPWLWGWPKTPPMGTGRASNLIHDT